MSDSIPRNSPRLRDRSSDGGHTLASRHTQVTDPIATKRVCFYKSGDPQFSGLKMVINNRTFKTFDALLDTLSKKVPLPFGVRNITTPHGTHGISNLDELEDGKSYICSDQKKVKPINLEIASKKLLPWHTTRPVSAGRRATQLTKQSDMRIIKRDDSVVVLTPKKLIIFKNGDPGNKQIIMLQKKIMKTFESLLDHLTEVMQFTVVKLYTPDGRRVDSLQSLILCSGVVVASGREPFKLGSYDPEKQPLPTKLPGISNHVQPKHRRKLKQRNQKYFVNQINSSVAGSLYDIPNPSIPMGSVETCTCIEEDHSLMPADDDIEKSFRINQDGSMTVEMKVRLTIKEEETIQWSTTLSRSSLSSQMKEECISPPASHVNSPDSNTVASKGITYLSDYIMKEENDLSPEGNNGAHEEERDDLYTACRGSQDCDLWQDSEANNLTEATSEERLGFRRPPTPGPRRTRKMKQTSVESLRTFSEMEIQENVVGTYSYIEENENGEMKGEYCMVSQCSSRPVPPPRKGGLAEINNNEVQSTYKSTGVAEILKLQDNGEEITETVFHIVEHQSCHDNFFANVKLGLEGQVPCDRPASSDLALCPLNHEHKLHCRRPSTASQSLNGPKIDNLSFSTDQMILSYKSRNDLSSTGDYEKGLCINCLSEASLQKAEFNDPGSENCMPCPMDHMSPVKDKKKSANHKTKKNNMPKNLSSNKQLSDNSDIIAQKQGTNSNSSDMLSHTASPGEKVMKHTEGNDGQQLNKCKNTNKKNKDIEDIIINGSSGLSLSDNMYALNIESSKGFISEKELNCVEAGSMGNLNGSETELSFKKTVLPPIETQDNKIKKKQKRNKETSSEEIKSEQDLQEYCEGASLPDQHSFPLVKEYVENWLVNMHSESEEGLDEATQTEEEHKVLFQIGSNPSEESEVTGEIQEQDVENLDMSKNRIIKRPLESVPKMEKLDETPDADSHKKLSLMASADTTSEVAAPQPRTQQTAEAAIQTNLGEFCISVKDSAAQADMKPILEQLGFSVKSMKQMSNNRRPSCLEKSSSLPDFSSHVASTFGSTSKVILAILSVMTLKQGITCLDTTESLQTNRSCTEALKLMESLKKLASIEDAEELQACLSNLQKSTSLHLLQTWRDHQELVEKGQDRSSLPNSSENEALFEACTEENNTVTEDPFGIQDLIEELGISEEIEKELTSMINQNDEIRSNEDESIKQEVFHDPGCEISVNEPLCLHIEDIHGKEEFKTLEEATYVEEHHCLDQLAPMHDLHISESDDITDVTHLSNEQKVIDKFMGESPEGFVTNDIEYANEKLSVVEDVIREDEENEIPKTKQLSDDTDESSQKESSSSSLVFSYDSKINIKKDTDGVRVKSIKEMFMAKSNQEIQYGKKRLPSPPTSDFSDYRPETSDSAGSGYRSQASCEMTTESGDDDTGRHSISKGYVRRTIERLYGKNETTCKALGVKRPPSAPKPKRKESPGQNSIGSIISLKEGKPKVIADLSYFNAKGSFDLVKEPVQYIAKKSQSPPDDGVLIDKGRWLLKENHLIRKSPPEQQGMYGNVETTSAETGLDNTSEDAPYSHFGSHHPPLAIISSSELEELAKPMDPKCTYFNMPHASDSEPFHDDLSIKSKGSLLCSGAVDNHNKKKDHRKLETVGEPTKMWAEKNGSLPSFASVEFRLPANKVHPEPGPSVGNVVVAQPARTGGKWTISVVTSSLRSAGTSSQVYVLLYGDRGNSGPLFLYGNQDSFQNSQEDIFDITVGNIGELYKIRIGHTNSGDSPAWHCEEVRLQNLCTEEMFFLPVNRWLSREEDDGEICREVPVFLHGNPALPVTVYEARVVTGDLWNAGTDANVYITVYGENGDTGSRQLLNSKKPTKFCKGQTDVFTLEAVHLGHLSKVVIGHDGLGPGQGWFLEKVVLFDSLKDMEYTFNSNRWLDQEEMDGKIVRELYTADGLNSAIYLYISSGQELKHKIAEIWALEKWKFQRGNIIQLFCKLTGKCVRLHPDGTVDAFGDKRDIHGYFDVTEKRGNIRVFRSVQNRRLALAIDKGRVTALDNGGTLCELEVQIHPNRSVSLQSVRIPGFTVSFDTDGQPADGATGYSGFSRKFVVHVKGVLWDGAVILLNSSVSQALCITADGRCIGTGKQAEESYLRVLKASPGAYMFQSVRYQEKYLRIKDGRCDGTGTGDQYCQFKAEKNLQNGSLSLESQRSRGIYIGLLPDGQAKPLVHTGEANVMFYPQVIKYGRRKPSGTSASLSKETNTEQELVRCLTPVPPVSRPASVSSKRVKTKLQSPPVSLEDEWSVSVLTGSKGTKAQVSLWVYGDKGMAGPILLGKKNRDMLFLPWQQDEFQIAMRNIGEIYKIRIGHDGTSDHPEWNLERVTITKIKDGPTLIFHINYWLSRHRGNGEIECELPVVKEDGKPVYPIVKYQVTVYTGHLDSAETQSPVLLCLYGERGDSGLRLLHKSIMPNKFQKGQVDLFELEAVSLGALQKILLHCEAKNKSDYWYCEKVIIREPGGDSEYIFNCERWLPFSSQGIFKTGVELQIQEIRINVQPNVKEKAQVGDWKVTVVTGDFHSASTEANVYLYAYGENGVSGPVILGNGKHQLFNPNSADTFQVNLSNIGEMYKLRIGHDNSGEDPGWYMEEIILHELATDREISIPVHQWLTEDKGCGDVWTELPVPLPGGNLFPVLVYQVHVHTGSRPGADTDSTVYMNIFGSRGDTGKRKLHRSQNQEVTFQQGQVDIFNIEAVSLDKLRSVVIGHNGRGPGNGWFLEKVIVKVQEDDNESESIFLCNRWLDVYQDDGQTERELFVEGYEQIQRKSQKGTWKVLVRTSEDSPVPQQIKISMVIYGSEGKSDDIALLKNNRGIDSFLPGARDEFLVETGDVGDVYKIRVSCDELAGFQDWHLKSIQMEEVYTGKELNFDSNCWLSSHSEQTEPVKEFPVVIEGRKTLPVHEYIVSIHMGDTWAAETYSNVYITLHGERGDSGVRQLRHSLVEGPAFQKNKVDSFLLESVSLGRLTKVVVGHDGEGYGAGLYLKLITVQESRRTGTEWVFPCFRWLDDHIGEQSTVCSLMSTGERSVAGPKLQECSGVWLFDISGSDITSTEVPIRLTITVHGDKGYKKLRLHMTGSESHLKVSKNSKFIQKRSTGINSGSGQGASERRQRNTEICPSPQHNARTRAKLYWNGYSIPK
ncbi:oxygen-regulated protein 1 [Amia ocellicauda]|uniref:oxygen-regulated protein 1 n=1 Tax=Amia ocellicauda TaxID=2972642 RepID=UPI0034649ED8